MAFIRLSAGDTPSPLAPGRPLTLEFAVVPEKEPDNSVPRLLSFCDAEGNRLFEVGQWKSELILRSASPGPYRPKAYSEMGASGVLTKQGPRHIAIVFRGGDVVVYAGGKFAKERRDFPLFRRADVSPGLIVVGNSPDGKNPWIGDLLFLAIHDRILSPEEIGERYRRLEDRRIPEEDSGAMPLMEYTFAERDGDVARNRAGGRFPLVIPRSFRPVTMILLEMPGPEEFFTRSNFLDIFINVFGFVPFGILAAAWLNTGPGRGSAFRIFFLLILAGGAFSLCIETVQAFLPDRSSSLLDVIANILGTLIGGGPVFGLSRKE